MEKIKKVAKALVTIGLVGGIALSSVGNASAAQVHYKDVNKADNFYKSVEYLLSEDAISKTLPNFRPYENITRGQFASIFAKVLDLDVANVENPNFIDVPTTHQFYKYIAALKNEGIIGGKSDCTFGVNEPLTGGQMAGILVKAYEIPLVGVQDVRRHNNYKQLDIVENNSKYINEVLGEHARIEDYKFKGEWGQQIGTMNYFGLISGNGNGDLTPSQPVKRSQLANMLYQIQSKDVNEKFVFVEVEELKRLGIINYHHGKLEEESVIKINDWVTDDKSYHYWYDPIIQNEQPYYDYAEYVIFEPKKEGVAYFINNDSIKIIVSKDNEGKWKVDFEKVIEENPNTTGDTSPTITQDTVSTETE